jgi:hypothetical protein
MKAHQLLLFKAHLSHEAHWKFDSNGWDDPANIAIDLLDKGRDEVKFTDIAAIRCDLQLNELIPIDKHDIFTQNVEIVRDNRYLIKDRIEERSTHRLVITGEEGQSARMNGRGAAAGFRLRASDAGIQDDRAQLKMALGSARMALRRSPELRKDPDIQALITIPALTGNEIHKEDVP